MDFYTKAEPAGEFATGVVNIKEVEIEDYGKLVELQFDSEYDSVRTYGIPIIINGGRDTYEKGEIKDVILDSFFTEVPYGAVDNIKWEFDSRIAEKELEVDDERIFIFAEHSKYSASVEGLEEVENFKPESLCIRVAYVEFHNDINVCDEEIEDMWVLEGVTYEDEESDVYLEMEMVDRGIDTIAELHDDNFNVTDLWND